MLNRKWAPKSILNLSNNEMTVNQRYRLMQLSLESQLAYECQQFKIESTKFIEKMKNNIQKIYQDDQDELENKLERLEV